MYGRLGTYGLVPFHPSDVSTWQLASVANLLPLEIQDRVSCNNLFGLGRSACRFAGP